jgi:hypothetical protein
VERIAARVAQEMATPQYAGRAPREVSAAIRRSLASGERYAVGVLDARAQARLGAASLAVWLSDDTLIKQMLHHGADELPATGYLRLQQVIDGARYVGVAGDTRLVFFQQDGDWAVAVIKRTRDGRENYLVSIRKGSQVEVDRSVRAGTLTPW